MRHARGSGQSLAPDNNSLARFRIYPLAGPKTAAPGSLAWDSLMHIALEEAEICARMGEVPVGAVLVDPTGAIVARTGNRVETMRDVTAHAEILALRQGAARRGNHRLGGCVLISTLEPCLMCAGAIGHARIAGLVFGAADAAAGAIVSRADYYDLPGAQRAFWHLGGVLAEQCAEPLREFFSRRR